jgi:arginyl-tRNA synthetase
MLFNPQESIDFQGDTGPFVLYTYARIQSILRKAENTWKEIETSADLELAEINLMQQIYQFPRVLDEASKMYSPSDICQYCLKTAKAFNRIYNELPLLQEMDIQKRATRLKLANFTANNLKTALCLLGINVVDRM